MEKTETLKTFAIVEIMGQKKVAGFVRTEVFGSTCMLRVDIPETIRTPAFTQYYGMNSIYCLTPVDGETAQKTAESLKLLPSISWEQEQFLKKEISYRVGKEIESQKQLDEAFQA